MLLYITCQQRGSRKEAKNIALAGNDHLDHSHKDRKLPVMQNNCQLLWAVMCDAIERLEKILHKISRKLIFALETGDY